MHAFALLGMSTERFQTVCSECSPTMRRMLVPGMTLFISEVRGLGCTVWDGFLQSMQSRRRPSVSMHSNASGNDVTGRSPSQASHSQAVCARKYLP